MWQDNQPDGYDYNKIGMRMQVTSNIIKEKKKKEIQYKILTAVPVLLLMGVIFAFSAKTATKSMEESDAVVDIVMGLAQEGKDAQPSDREKLYEMLVVIVRKGAHMAEYAVLCMLAALHLTTWKLPYRKLAISSVLFAAFYAATDEFHQLFVEGRSGEVKDVLIDSAGAVLGILAFTIIRLLVLRYQRKKCQ